MRKVKETIIIAVLVSAAAQVNIDLFVNGFIIAMSVVVFATFLYFYDHLSPLYIAILSGIFSPFFRMCVLVLTGTPIWETFLKVIPDSLFFFTFGGLYYLIYYKTGHFDKNRRNFPLVIFICDVLSNTAELTMRSIIANESVFTFHMIKYLVIIALIRAVVIQLLIIILESYSSLLLRQEHDEKYRKLVVLASIFESELYLMNKNTAEIEDITQKAYSLYKSMESLDTPPAFKKTALEISTNAHEVKNDYVRTTKALKDNFVTEYSLEEMHIRDIIYILKSDIDHQIKEGNYRIDFITKITGDFSVDRHFDMMSILRNLVINSIEAIGSEKGFVRLSITQKGDRWLLTVRDNGHGISEENQKYIFSHGFSTKFDDQTGDISRGVGLTLVKSYVEETFHGTIQVHSKEGVFTEFELEFPMEANQ